MMSTDRRASIDLPGRRESVRQARQFVADFLADSSADDVDGMRLVVSELVTNAIEHGSADQVHVEVDRDGPVLRLTVRGGRGFIPDPTKQQMAPPEQLSGRGLQIVRSLTDSMTISGDDAEHAVVVTKALG